MSTESSNSTTGVPAEGEGQSLLPCPWCGEPAEVVAEIETLPPKPLTVCCGNTACPIVRKFFPVEAWNTRTNSINTTLPAEDGQDWQDLHDEIEYNAMVETINELAKERDTLYSAAVATLKYIENLDGPPTDPKCAIHLSDDIVDDRCAPFNRVAQPSREVPAEPQYMKRLENAFLMAYDLAGIDASPLPEVLPESAYTPGYMDKVRELREVFALASAHHDQESGKEARLVIPDSVDLEAGREQGIKEGIERSAARAFDAVKAIETSPHAHNYSTLQKAACVAASVRALSNSKRSFWDATYLGKYANKSETQLIEASSNSISGVPAGREGQSLLPCPWCGEPAEVVAEIETLPPKPLTVCCGNTACPIVRKFFPVEAWNTRTNSINTTLPAEDGQSEVAAIRERRAKITEPPWFVAFDGAKECGPHKDSGLALVDTGRESDWPIARLCEWPQAEFIAHAPTDIDFLLALITTPYSAAVATLKYIENLDGPPTDPHCPECVEGVYYDPSGPEPEMCWVHLVKRAVKIGG